MANQNQPIQNPAKHQEINKPSNPMDGQQKKNDINPNDTRDLGSKDATKKWDQGTDANKKSTSQEKNTSQERDERSQSAPARN